MVGHNLPPLIEIGLTHLKIQVRQLPCLPNHDYVPRFLKLQVGKQSCYESQNFGKLAKKKLIVEPKFQVMGGVGILSLLINLPVFWFINNRDLNCNDQLRLILITIPTLVMRLIIPMLALTIFSCLTVRKVHFLTFPACF